MALKLSKKVPPYAAIVLKLVQMKRDFVIKEQ
jgi:hypothetical protein